MSFSPGWALLVLAVASASFIGLGVSRVEIPTMPETETQPQSFIPPAVMLDPPAAPLQRLPVSPVPPQQPNIALYKSACAAVCGSNYVRQDPEMRNHLTCIDGQLKELDSDRGREDCTRFDHGPWARRQNARWCVQVNMDVTLPNWHQPVQCLGLVPEN